MSVGSNEPRGRKHLRTTKVKQGRVTSEFKVDDAVCTPSLSVRKKAPTEMTRLCQEGVAAARAARARMGRVSGTQEALKARRAEANTARLAMNAAQREGRHITPVYGRRVG